MPATAKALLAAATSATARTAPLSVRTAPAERSTADAQAMGITGVVGSYYTTYGGIPSRLHNVALVAKLIDGALVAPGKTFSFNGTTGERTAEKGFEEAPVIINGELQTGLGGGICQVSTTVFNAVYEAGLQIDERTNHALYISHYPLGRDATVNYPDLDLKFTNDTDHWLLLRTFVGSGSLTVNLYGTPQNRRVETTAQPLRVVGAPTIKRVPDPTLEKGTSEVDEYGQPARSTSVSRKVYDADGAVLHEDTWYSSYRSEPKVVRVGTKPKPKPKAKPKPTKADTAAPRRRPTSRTRRRRLRRLSPSDRLDEPRRQPDRPVRAAVDDRVRRPPFRHRLAVPLDHVLVAEARTAEVDAARPDPQPVVEAHGREVAHVHLGRERLDALLLDRPVAAGVLGEVADARDLEPDDEGGVVRDPLGVRLREADDDVGREVVALHREDFRSRDGSPYAAARRTVRSSRTVRQSVQTFCSTSYGIPACWRSACAITALCSCSWAARLLMLLAAISPFTLGAGRLEQDSKR